MEEEEKIETTEEIMQKMGTDIMLTTIVEVVKIIQSEAKPGSRFVNRVNVLRKIGTLIEE